MYCCLCQGTCEHRNKSSCSVQRAEERLTISSEYLFSKVRGLVSLDLYLVVQQRCHKTGISVYSRTQHPSYTDVGLQSLCVPPRLWRARETLKGSFVLSTSIRISIILITVLVWMFFAKNNTSFHLQRCTLTAQLSPGAVYEGSDFPIQTGPVWQKKSIWKEQKESLNQFLM